jgi:hypothetical protein
MGLSLRFSGTLHPSYPRPTAWQDMQHGRACVMGALPDGGDPSLTCRRFLSGWRQRNES